MVGPCSLLHVSAPDRGTARGLADVLLEPVLLVAPVVDLGVGNSNRKDAACERPHRRALLTDKLGHLGFRGIEHRVDQVRHATPDGGQGEVDPPLVPLASPAQDVAALAQTPQRRRDRRPRPREILHQ